MACYDESMNILQNPSQEKVAELIEQSEMKAAKWLKDLETGDLFYWPADWNEHSRIAETLQIKVYKKGIATSCN